MLNKETREQPSGACKRPFATLSKRIATTTALVATGIACAQATTSDGPEVELRDMVVTATRTYTPADEIGFSLSVIDREEIESSRATFAKDVLDMAPGLHFWSNGPHSSGNALSIRGLRGYHTKVLVDGIPRQDTSGPQVLPTLDDLLLADAERIEIIRGSSSVLYGPNAVAGVINIITRKPDEGIQGSLTAEAGSHNWQKYSASVLGREGDLDFYLSSTYIDEKGISATEDNPDRNALRQYSYAAGAGYQADENLRIEAYGRYDESDQEYDEMAGIGEWKIQRYTAGASLKAQNLFEIIDTTLSFGTVESRRDERVLNELFKGNTHEANLINSIRFNDRNLATLGYTHAREEAKVDTRWTSMDESYYSNAVFAQHQIEALERLFLIGGVRYSDHSAFGGETTYSTAASYMLEPSRTRMFANYSTGYRAPSLFELFDPTNGNPDLNAEKSQSWEMGLEQRLVEDQLKVGITYFDMQVDDYIDWSPTGYAQVEGISSQGIEGFLAYRPTDNISLRLAHSYIDARDDRTDERLLRIPRNKTILSATYSMLEQRLRTSLQAQHVKQRELIDFSSWPASRVEGDDYTLANLALSFKLTDNIEIYGRVQNLLDEDYQTVYGYNTYKRTYYGGATLSF